MHNNNNMPVKLDLKYAETFDPYTLGIEDVSNYGNYPIQTPLLTVTPPNGYPTTELPFQTEEVNVYDYGDIIHVCGGNCPELPDGNYVFEYSIKPNNKHKVKKNYFRITHALSMFFRLFMESTDECNCEDNRKALDELFEIKMLLEGAVASANMCDVCLAEKKYNIAIRKIKQYGNKCSC